jgi:hypothetical protein
MVVSGRTCVVAVAIAYLVMFAASASRMSPRERRETLLPWGMQSDTELRFRTNGTGCTFRNVVIGDGAIGTNSHCVTEQHGVNHER